MTRSLLFTLLVASALGQVCLPPRAAGQTSKYCAGASLSVDNPFAGEQLQLSENTVQSTYVTTGLLEVRNDGAQGIREILLQIEYKFDDQAPAMVLTYGATITGKTGSYVVPLTKDLQPGEAKVLITEDIHVAKICPKTATLTALRIHLANGTEVHKGLEWSEETLPREIPRLAPSIRDSLDAETAYSVEISVNDMGDVTGVRSLRSNSPPLPQTLVANIKQWIFYPARRNGASIPSQLDLVIRLNKSGCKIQECKTRIPLNELPQFFVYVDLVDAGAEQGDSHGTRVYFGGVPVVEGQEISW